MFWMAMSGISFNIPDYFKVWFWISWDFWFKRLFLLVLETQWQEKENKGIGCLCHGWYQCVMILQMPAVSILSFVCLFLYIINLFGRGRVVLTAAVFVGVVQVSTILSIRKKQSLIAYLFIFVSAIQRLRKTKVLPTLFAVFVQLLHICYFNIQMQTFCWPKS